jgi:GNAT superfamily N-acetyltransferase
MSPRRSEPMAPPRDGASAGAVAQHAPAVRVAPVRGRSDLDRFIRLPWRIYRDDPHWVPPLIREVRLLLDRERHPFHRHAEVATFLAWRDGEVVGRIASIVNHTHVSFHDERAGFFGLFETIDDTAVARALLDTAAAWVAERGMTTLRGPMNLSTNDELYSPGVLIDGFDVPPTLLMAHTPRYYARLLEAAGFVKAKDLVAYWLEGDAPPDRLLRGLARLQRTEDIRVRSLEMRDFDAEVRRVQDIYNSAWERNWAFVPMSAEEIAHMARALKPIVNPRLCVIAESAGEPVGFALALPDYNQALRHIDGRLFPFGVFKLLWHRRRIDTARIITLGLRPGYRHKGLDAMMIVHLFREGPPAGYARGECSWILEDNWEMRRGIERIGGHVYKTYRVYERRLAR